MKSTSLTITPSSFLLLWSISVPVASFSGFRQFPWDSTTLRTEAFTSSTSRLWSLQDNMKDLFFGTRTIFNKEENLKVDQSNVGTVIRLAGRDYNSTSSKPSSKDYTTRKDAMPFAQVTPDGVQGDYNHYRTTALKSTKDRALSILTADVMKSLRLYYKNYSFQDGDLGENVLVDGRTFDSFEVGKRYQFVSTSNDEITGDSMSSIVEVEITEPIKPCANLCKLPYINDNAISPKDRIKRCQEFIEHLDRVDGYRGWYAKVIRGGDLKCGAQVYETSTTIGKDNESALKSNK